MMACFQVRKPLHPLPTVLLLMMIMCSLLSCSHAKQPWFFKSSGSDQDDCPTDTSDSTACGSFAASLSSSYRNRNANSPLFKFSDDDSRGYFVIPLQTIQEPSLFISPRIPPPTDSSLEPSGPTWTTITYSAIVLAMCKYILFAM
ncbi:hypothetical protein PAHAL_7G010700 [Panicum hallii]|jgi:hypothetical protein|uniref:Uncharacterized protein n=1 Tax=Panicum hallii TaxID=206008 RepID=A0A2T8IAJ0_9POAL|nr:hypothetical protein PAHAL_7G010700 [Panicum hallii]